jgi:lipid II:glycine glycyltransferase (peptidoglycan interpeptide bridge formation enzyme)
VLTDLAQLAKHTRAIFIKVDPDVTIGIGVPGSADQQTDPIGEEVSRDFRDHGWRLSEGQVQFRNTFLIDLRIPNETLLARMKQKTRYNIRLAQRKGVQTRLGSAEELDLAYRMYAETSIRDGFTIRDRQYYLRTWSVFLEKGLADFLLAEVEGEPVAGLILFRFGGKAWYMYGMSRAIHREKMPTYLLQWAAMQRAKEMNCNTYDLWGAPDEFSETDPMWGVFRFKEGLGGQVIRTNGAWDFPVNLTLYRLYNQILPRFLTILRKRGKEQIRRSIEAS